MRGKYFVALGVSLLAIGAAAGFVGTKRAVEARADGPATITSVTLQGSFDGWTTGVPFVETDGDYALTYYLEQDEEFIFYVTGGSEQWVKASWEIPAENIDSDYVGAAGNSNFKAKSSQWFTFTITSDFYTNWGSTVTLRKVDIPSYTIAKYAVVNGETEAEPFDTDQVPHGDEYNPGRVNRTGYHFGGWFTTAACDTPLVDFTPTGNGNVYAKYTTLSKDSYIYYITNSNEATADMIHSWGGDVEYASRDVSITGIAGVEEVTGNGVLHFDDSNVLIYKIPYSSEAGDTGFKFHYNNWATESDGYVWENGSAFKWGWNPSWNPDDVYDGAAAGDAIDFLIQAEAVRNAASYKEHSHSVCGISKENANILYSAYAALSENAKGYVNHSTTYTYTDGSFAEGMVSYEDIVKFLKAKAEEESGEGILSIQGMKEEQTMSAAIIAALAAVVGIGFVSFVVIRRKKINL